MPDDQNKTTGGANKGAGGGQRAAGGQEPVTVVIQQPDLARQGAENIIEGRNLQMDNATGAEYTTREGQQARGTYIAQDGKTVVNVDGQPVKKGKAAADDESDDAGTGDGGEGGDK
jgi:hypothetical protein